jgi:hypothetical protein
MSSIFRVEKIVSGRNQHESRWHACLLIFLTLKMEAIYSSETSVDTQQTTRRYIPEDCNLQVKDGSADLICRTL